MNVDRQHSRLGTASFILSIVAGFFIALIAAVAGILEVSSPGGINEESKLAMTLDVVVVALLILDAAALGLGIAGLFQKERIKIFAAIGIVLSSATLLGTAGLIWLGLSAG